MKHNLKASRYGDIFQFQKRFASHGNDFILGIERAPSRAHTRIERGQVEPAPGRAVPIQRDAHVCAAPYRLILPLKISNDQEPARGHAKSIRAASFTAESSRRISRGASDATALASVAHNSDVTARR